MSAPEPGDLAAFRRLLQDDAALVSALRPILDREAFAAAAVASGAGCGLVFTEAEVEAAIHADRFGWVSHRLAEP